MARPKRNTAAAKAAVESVKAAVAAEPVKAVEETPAAVTEEKKPAAKKPAANKPAAVRLWPPLGMPPGQILFSVFSGPA